MNKKFFQQLRVRLAGSAAGIFVALLAGCGAGGNSVSAGVGTGGTGSLAKITGYAADGYLVNATTFLDRNGNYRLDEGEPSTFTDGNGAFTLDVDPADIGKCPIVVLAMAGVTVDKDTGTAVTISNVFSMHAATVSNMSSNFISPMSSLVRELVETGRSDTVQNAMEAVRVQLGLPAGTDITADYMATNNTAMHTAARNMAILMGGQMPQIISMNGSTMTIDVNGYRTMMGTMFSNMPSMMGANWGGGTMGR